MTLTARSSALVLLLWLATLPGFAVNAPTQAAQTSQAFGKVVSVTVTQIQIQTPGVKTVLILIVKPPVSVANVKKGDVVSVVYESSGKNNVLDALEVSGAMPGAPANVPKQDYGRTASLDLEAKPGTALTPEQGALIASAIINEKSLVASVERFKPLAQTYVQDSRVGVGGSQAPVADQYALTRVDLSGSASARPVNPGQSTTLENRLLQTMFVDPAGFDEKHYVFTYVRSETLGSVRTLVFDVRPRVNVAGRFTGRIWVEDRDGNIVRFNGAVNRQGTLEASSSNVHFDSWRENLQPGLWLPVGTYAEGTEHSQSRGNIAVRAQTKFWGYAFKGVSAGTDNETVSIHDAADQDTEDSDVSPLDASRAWIAEAESSVIDRLVEAGLVAPLQSGGIEGTVEQIAINLEVTNSLEFADPIRCRVLLSDTIEATTIGNTILLSKGLLVAAPNEESLASVVAIQLAHIALGHKVQTAFAFNDRLLFSDDVNLKSHGLLHSEEEDAEAAKMAMDYLKKSPYKDKLADAGVLWAEVGREGKVLKALTTPILGDSLLKPDGSPWLGELAKLAPKPNPGGAPHADGWPVGDWIRTNPWNDGVSIVSAGKQAPLSSKTKTPLEIEPLYFNLQRYGAEEPGSTAAAPQ